VLNSYHRSTKGKVKLPPGIGRRATRAHTVFESPPRVTSDLSRPPPPIVRRHVQGRA
jgi:hypothetical protein